MHQHVLFRAAKSVGDLLASPPQRVSVAVEDELDIPGSRSENYYLGFWQVFRHKVPGKGSAVKYNILKAVRFIHNVSSGRRSELLGSQDERPLEDLAV